MSAAGALPTPPSAPSPTPWPRPACRMPGPTADHEDGRLVVTVTGADPGRVRDAAAGFALTIRSGPAPAVQTPAK